MDAVAVAFVVLGVATAIGWLRRRDSSKGWLALAIILLAAVIGEGRLQAHLPFKIPLLGAISLLAFMACAYAVLRYRDAIIPLPRRWHVAAAVSLTAASVTLLTLQAVAANAPASARTALAIAAIAI